MDFSRPILLHSHNKNGSISCVGDELPNYNVGNLLKCYETYIIWLHEIFLANRWWINLKVFCFKLARKRPWSCDLSFRLNIKVVAIELSTFAMILTEVKLFCRLPFWETARLSMRLQLYLRCHSSWLPGSVEPFLVQAWRLVFGPPVKNVIIVT